MIFDYLALTFLLFFITFFFDIFYRYIRYREITPRKMFTFKEGGLFEHYIIVAILLLVIISAQFVTGMSPFEDNILFRVINLFTFTSISLIFLVFVLVFIFYFISILYVKIRKIEDKQGFYLKHSHRIIRTAFIIASILVGVFFVQSIIQLFN